MLENTLDYQKKLHVERLGELIDKVDRLPETTFPDQGDAREIAGYLAMVREELRSSLSKEDEDV